MFYTLIKNADGALVGVCSYSAKAAVLQTNETACDQATYEAALVTVTTKTLPQQAAVALMAAQNYVTNNYILLAETPPDEWVTYQKALIAISNGTDTTSTVLPISPLDAASATTTTAPTSTDTTTATTSSASTS